MAEKKLSFNQIRINKVIAIAKDFRENDNLSYGEASKKADIIDSYLYGGNFKRGNKYKGNDKLILRHLPKSRIKTQKKTSILNKVN